MANANKATTISIGNMGESKLAKIKFKTDITPRLMIYTDAKKGSAIHLNMTKEDALNLAASICQFYAKESD